MQYKIGIDAKRFFFNNTGLGRYTQSLVNGLHPPYIDQNIRVILYTPKRPKASFEDFTLKSFNRTKITAPSVSWPLWRSIGLTQNINKDKLDLYHGPSHEIPFETIKRFQCPTVVTMHDLIFLRFPELFPLIDRSFYQLKYKSSCQRASGVIAISEQTRQDLINFWDIPEEKIEVIHQSIDPIFFSALEMATSINKTATPIHKKPYILYVGTLNRRKNALLLIKAFKQSKLANDFELVLIGRGNEYKKECQSWIDKNQINAKILSGVNDCDLPEWYLGASLFVYPSLFEGFGIPVVEAQALGIPIIVTKNAGLDDAANPMALKVDPKDSQDLSNAMEKLIFDTELRDQQIQAGFDHAQNFHPKIVAPKIWNYYKKLM